MLLCALYLLMWCDMCVCCVLCNSFFYGLLDVFFIYPSSYPLLSWEHELYLMFMFCIPSNLCNGTVLRNSESRLTLIGQAWEVPDDRGLQTPLMFFLASTKPMQHSKNNVIRGHGRYPLNTFVRKNQNNQGKFFCPLAGLLLTDWKALAGHWCRTEWMDTVDPILL